MAKQTQIHTATNKLEKQSKVGRKAKAMVIEVENDYGHGNQWRRGPVTGSSRSGQTFMATIKRNMYGPTIANRLRPLMAVKSTGISTSSALRYEKMVLDDLQDCPYIRRVFGEETIDKTRENLNYNILLEYPSGGTLENLIYKSGGLVLREDHVWHYTRCLLLGLHHLHDRGYVHRNLKLENIMLVRRSNISVGYIAKIGEYESVVHVEMSKKRLWNPYASIDIDYLSPEAYRSSQQGPESDIWAVGCIVYEMLTGKSIWDDQNYKNIKDELCNMINGFGSMEVSNNWISNNAKMFLNACFEIKAEKRWNAERLLALPFLKLIT